MEKPLEINHIAGIWLKSAHYLYTYCVISNAKRTDRMLAALSRPTPAVQSLTGGYNFVRYCCCAANSAGIYSGQRKKGQEIYAAPQRNCSLLCRGDQMRFLENTRNLILKNNKNNIENIPAI